MVVQLLLLPGPSGPTPFGCWAAPDELNSTMN
jgi:hypothetical protein